MLSVIWDGGCDDLGLNVVVVWWCVGIRNLWTSWWWFDGFLYFTDAILHGGVWWHGSRVLMTLLTVYYIYMCMRETFMDKLCSHLMVFCILLIQCCMEEYGNTEALFWWYYLWWKKVNCVLYMRETFMDKLVYSGWFSIFYWCSVTCNEWWDESLVLMTFCDNNGWLIWVNCWLL